MTQASDALDKANSVCTAGRARLTIVTSSVAMSCARQINGSARALKREVVTEWWVGTVTPESDSGRLNCRYGVP
ncbi:hypothetical protein TPA0908_39530 [Micromonospora sp. AKA38]|nr:hypothetical protein TPA0908_39530 [Micromonospora sp. AKA38]